MLKETSGTSYFFISFGNSVIPNLFCPFIFLYLATFSFVFYLFFLFLFLLPCLSFFYFAILSSFCFLCVFADLLCPFDGFVVIVRFLPLKKSQILKLSDIGGAGREV